MLVRLRSRSIPIPLSGSYTQQGLTSPVGSPNNFGTSPMAQLHGGSFSTSPSNFPSNPPSSRQPRQLQLLGSKEIKILLLENISAGAVDFFKAQGYQVEHHLKAWSEEELLKRIGEFHAIGIRSKTKLTEKVVKAATKVRRLLLLLRNGPADFTARPPSPPIRSCSPSAASASAPTRSTLRRPRRPASPSSTRPSPTRARSPSSSWPRSSASRAS